MNKIQTIVVFFAVLSIPMSLGLNQAFAGTAPDANEPATITIGLTCGVSPSGSLAYTGLDVGATTTDVDEQIINILNTGNRDVNIIVSATNWVNSAAPATVVMNAGQTHFDTNDNTAYGSQTTMTLDPATATVLNGLTPQSNQNVWHKVQIALVPAQASFSGAANQTEIFAFDCP